MDRAPARTSFREHFGPAAAPGPSSTGPAPTSLAIDALTRPHEAVICAAGAHIDVDECGAPERFAGVKLLTVDDRARQADAGATSAAGTRARRRAPRPAAARLDHAGDRARHGLLGRRSSRALADGRARARDAAARRRRPARQRRRLARRRLRELTTDAGVDAVSFGGDQERARLSATPSSSSASGRGASTDAVRAQAGDAARLEDALHLAPSSRRCSASDLWLRTAGTPTRWRRGWGRGSQRSTGVELVHPVEANGVFARLPRPAIDALMARAARRAPLLRLGRGATTWSAGCAPGTRPRRTSTRSSPPRRTRSAADAGSEADRLAGPAAHVDRAAVGDRALRGVGDDRQVEALDPGAAAVDEP